MWSGRFKLTALATYKAKAESHIYKNSQGGGYIAQMLKCERCLKHF